MATSPVPEAAASSKPPTVTNSDGAGLLFQVALCQAAELARHGRYGEADAVLAELARGRPRQPMILDMRARLRAQVGQFAEAEELWQQARQQDPSNPDYIGALDCVARFCPNGTHQKPGFRFVLARSLAGFFRLIGIFLIILAICHFVGLVALAPDAAGDKDHAGGLATLGLFLGGMLAIGMAEGLRILLVMEANLRMALTERKPAGKENAFAQLQDLIQAAGKVGR